MKQKWKPTQYVEISIYEIFAFQDKLDAVQDNPEEVWKIVDDFFWECENQLELDPNFIRELQEIDLTQNFVEMDLKNCDEFFDEDFDDPHEKTAQDYVNYVFAQIDKKRYDIPFRPRLNF